MLRTLGRLMTGRCANSRRVESGPKASVRVGRTNVEIAQRFVEGAWLPTRCMSEPRAWRIAMARRKPPAYVLLALLAACGARGAGNEAETHVVDPVAVPA